MANAPLYFIVWQEGKHCVSQCLNVDISSFGKTKEKAVQNLNEALELYFEDEPTLRASSEQLSLSE